MMVSKSGISFSRYLFSGAMLVSGSVYLISTKFLSCWDTFVEKFWMSRGTSKWYDVVLFFVFNMA